MLKTEQDFYNNIGKKIYRVRTTCKCSTCKNVYLNGIVVFDEMHANYLYDWHCEGISYFTTELERNIYERFKPNNK